MASAPYTPWGDATISGDGVYRYRLQRRWADGRTAPIGRWWLRVVMLNPSTADASLDDPTIRRVIGFAKREGFTAVAVFNLYAFRATDPKVLLTCGDPIGPDNDFHIRDSLRAAREWQEPVLAAWGVNAKPERVAKVLSLVDGVDWRCLGTTKDGHPRHPLYVKGDQPFVPFATSSSAGSGEQSEQCPHGDPTCPCPDGLACHYEGPDAWPAVPSEQS